MMQKNKRMWILIMSASVLICGICFAAVILVSGQKKSEKYYDLMRSARRYLTEGDYENVIAAYKAAIDLKPEDPESYMELVSLYMEEDRYVEAADYARMGFTATRDRRFESLLEEINSIRYTRGNPPADADTNGNGAGDDAGNMGFVAEPRDDSKVAVRNPALELLTGGCFQEYVDAYGSSTITAVSAEEGYLVRFAGLGAAAYFKNTKEYPALIDKSTRIPAKNACPYKVVVTSPTSMFVNFDGYISYEKLCRLFKTNASVIYDETQEIHCLAFDFGGCSMIIETDSAGNVFKSNPLIEFLPGALMKEDWVEETETEETEVETFVLGGRTYTYDVTEIEIYGQSIEDISPLSRCDRLVSLILQDCTLGSLDSLSGCVSLAYLDMRGSTGFWDISVLAGINSLLYLDLHSCADVSDISPIMDKSLSVLHTCETGVTYEQTMEYKQKHPECEVWYDNHVI